MTKRQSNAYPHYWQWMLEQERRVTTLEQTTEKHGQEITGLKGSKPLMTPRGWVMAAAGVMVVIAAVARRITIHEAVSLLSGLK